MNPVALPNTESSTPNELLAAFPDEERMRIAPYMRSCALKAGEVLHEAAETRSWIYFPCGAIVSLRYVMENGNSTEIAMVGREGLVGVSMLLSGSAALDCAVVQRGGSALRMHANELRKEFARGAMWPVLLRYMQALMAQTGQTAICNRYHSVDRQLCRWLLMSLDRLPGNEMIMSQETIAIMLGVRRESVAVAAGALQRAGAIEYKHGRIQVTDRPRLESLACECYEVVRAEFARLLPWSSLSVSGRRGPTAICLPATSGSEE